MSSDVLFIIHDLYQEDNQFPLGIGYLSTILENNGYSVEIYNMDIYHYTNEQLAKKLDNNEYKLIGLNFLASRFKETVLELCNIINKHKKSAWLVLGGHGASPIPEYMLTKTNCDSIAVGEAEISILEIMKDIEIGNNKKIYHSKPIININEIPLPKWDLFPMDIYTNNIFFSGMEKGDKSFQVISSRGCINECTFCYRMEKGIRLRNIDKVVEEISLLKDKYGVNVIRFQDELFLISKKRLIQFKDSLKKYGLDIKFTANARADIFDRESALILREINCLLLNVGFESSSQKVLNYMNKNVTVEQNIKTLEISKEMNLPTGLNFIWGYPPDNKDTLINNMKLIKKYNLYQQLRTLRPVTPYPGCELYYEAINKKLISGPEEFFNRFDNSDLITVNFTKYPNKTCYKWLLDVNRKLIYDHYKHIDGDMIEAKNIVNNFKYLYEGKCNKFRGARHYNEPIKR